MVSLFKSSDSAMQLPQGNVREPGDFPEDEFLTIENVPVFCEHETVASDGREIKFGYHELKLVADRCNRRIAETGDYAAITIGHTPSPEAKASGAADPDLVGFAGPYRMGLIGEPGTRQRHAILASFHIYRDEVGRYKRHPRRSPELWLEDQYEEMFLDPIALLGAEAPRLDLGLLYSASLHRDNRRVCLEKYSTVAPSPGNVFLPGEEKRCYSPEVSEGSVMDANDNLVAEICEAIGQTDEFQYLKKLMAEDSGDTGGGEVATETPSATLEAATAPDPVVEVVPPVAPSPVEDPEKMAKRYEACDEMDEEEFEKYSAHRKKRQYEADSSVDGEDVVTQSDVDEGASAKNYSVSGHRQSVNYQKLQTELRKQSDRSDQLANDLRTEMSKRVNAERYQRLQTLQLGGFVLDPDKEIKRLGCESLNDTQFDASIEAITEHYQRMPTLELPYSQSPSMDDPSRPGSRSDQERYSKSCAERANTICKQIIDGGGKPDYLEVLNKVKAGEPE